MSVRPTTLLMLALGLAAAMGLGWVIAPPRVPAQANDSDTAGVPLATGEHSRDLHLQKALASIRARQVWSVAGAGGGAEGSGKHTESTQKATAQPSKGLDAFTLVAIIRVGGKPEALLLRAGDTSGVLSASPGEPLGKSSVILRQIQGQRAELIQGARSRWLTLFPETSPSADGAGHDH